MIVNQQQGLGCGRWRSARLRPCRGGGRHQRKVSTGHCHILAKCAGIFNDEIGGGAATTPLGEIRSRFRQITRHRAGPSAQRSPESGPNACCGASDGFRVLAFILRVGVELVSNEGSRYWPLRVETSRDLNSSGALSRGTATIR